MTQIQTKVKSDMVHYCLKACSHCRGDLISEGDEWRCLQCSTIYYPVEILEIMNLPEGNHLTARSDLDTDRFYKKHKEVLGLFDAGLSSEEAAIVLGINPRSARRIREIYTDIKDNKKC